jgi:hypothetical protein
VTARLLGVVLFAVLAGAEHGPDATAEEAKAALERFTAQFRSKRLEERLQAVERLGAVLHPKVADRLLRLARELDDPALLAAAYQGMARQHSSAGKIARPVMRLLAKEAEAEREALAKGDLGYPVDPKTGDTMPGPEAERAVAAGKARSRMLVEALRCVEALGAAGPGDVDALATLLQSPHDPVVIETLGLLGRIEAWGALEPMLALFEMYPSPNRWATGAVVDLAGTNATAKAKWMGLFGHPLKQRARPDVFEALQASLKAITGQEFKAPVDLAEYLRRSEVLAEIRRRSRSR